MPRKTKQRQESPNENRGAKTDNENSQSAKGKDGREPTSDDPHPPVVGLKKFVQEFKGKQHRIIEARVVIVCSFGVFGKLLFSDMLAEMEKDSTTYASLTFAALCLLVIIFNTWLDYFPTRISDMQLREAKSQGLPLACLLVPMVCAASLHCALHSNKQFVDLLFLYLVVLCQLSVCSIVATLVHFISFPNSVVLYNFASIGISYGFLAWIEVPMWISLPAIAVYSVVGVWLLSTFPNSFTLGESAIVSHGVTMLFLDTSLQVIHLLGLVSLPVYMTPPRSVSVLYIELLLTGVGGCCLLLSPALYKISFSRNYYERKFWSGTFILLSLSVGFMAILPWLGALNGGHNAIAFVLFYMSYSYSRLALVVYWLLVSIATGIFVVAQSSPGSWAQPLKTKQPSALWMRKWFHMSALAVFVPGLVIDVDFLSFSASMVTFLFVVVELMRLFKMWPGGETLDSLLKPMCDNRDSGSIILSHLYLLLGFSLPLWLSPLRQYDSLLKLSMYSGVLALGVGDSVAAISGQLIGKTKWPGTAKTLEGTLMSILSQLLCVFIIVLLDSDISLPSLSQWAIVGGGIIITAIMEAYTWQIDNLILGLFQFAIFISFL